MSLSVRKIQPKLIKKTLIIFDRLHNSKKRKRINVRNMNPEEKRQYARDQYKKRKDKTSLIKVDSHDELCENQKITLNDGGKIDAEKAAAAIDNLSV